MAIPLQMTKKKKTSEGGTLLSFLKNSHNRPDDYLMLDFFIFQLPVLTILLVILMDQVCL